VLEEEEERDFPLRKCRMGLDHFPKQSQRVIPRTSSTAITSTPMRLRRERSGVWVAPVVGEELI